MSEEYLVNYCAPTMAGIKTGNLFSCFYSSEEELRGDLRKYNRIFMPRGLFLIPLKVCKGRALLYLFRRDRLAEDLSEAKASGILQRIGYKTDDYRSCISRLIGRLKETESFPHEIGLFLSYPPEDVTGFVSQGADKCKLVGYWKVYGDVKSAMHIFNEYDRCTSDYSARVRKGMGIDRLVVGDHKSA